MDSNVYFTKLSEFFRRVGKFGKKHLDDWSAALLLRTDSAAGELPTKRPRSDNNADEPSKKLAVPVYYRPGMGCAQGGRLAIPVSNVAGSQGDTAVRPIEGDLKTASGRKILYESLKEIILDGESLFREHTFLITRCWSEFQRSGFDYDWETGLQAALCFAHAGVLHIFSALRMRYVVWQALGRSTYRELDQRFRDTHVCVRSLLIDNVLHFAADADFTAEEYLQFRSLVCATPRMKCRPVPESLQAVLRGVMANEVIKRVFWDITDKSQLASTAQFEACYSKAVDKQINAAVCLKLYRLISVYNAVLSSNRIALDAPTLENKTLASCFFAVNFLIEFANALSRANSRTIAEFMGNSLSEHEKPSKSDDIVQEIHRIFPPHSPFPSHKLLETRLFGGELKYINVEAAKFILSLGKPTTRKNKNTDTFLNKFCRLNQMKETEENPRVRWSRFVERTGRWGFGAAANDFPQ